jgi:hypothetical protein
MQIRRNMKLPHFCKEKEEEIILASIFHLQMELDQKDDISKIKIQQINKSNQ